MRKRNGGFIMKPLPTRPSLRTSRNLTSRELASGELTSRTVQLAQNKRKRFVIQLNKQSLMSMIRQPAHIPSWHLAVAANLAVLVVLRQRFEMRWSTNSIRSEIRFKLRM